MNKKLHNIGFVLFSISLAICLIWLTICPFNWLKWLFFTVGTVGVILEFVGSIIDINEK